MSDAVPNFGLPDQTLAILRGILAMCPAVEKAVIYGSRAKGNYKPGSDIDLTLFGPGLTQDMLAQLAGQFDESSIPYKVDLSIWATIDNQDLTDHIHRVGQALYTRGN